MASALAYSVLCILLCGLHAGLVAAQAPTGSPSGQLHLVYYAQELQGGPNSTIIVAAGTGQGNFSGIGWGSFLAFDNYLREGPTADSKFLGMVTGTAVVTGSVQTRGLQMNAQHIFSGNFYNGSSLTVTGTILTPTSPSWECIVPGGTGAFRGYSGYAILAPVASATAPPVYVYQYDIFISPK